MDEQQAAQLNKAPEVSVLMSVYNGETYLCECMDSVLSQTFRDFEFIIVDDGSTDKSKEIVRSYKDDRIILLENTENKGLAWSLNRGIKHARGTYIARMDADDVMLPERLERQVQYLKGNPDIDGCGTWAKVVDETGKPLYELTPPDKYEQLVNEMIISNRFVHPSMCVKRSMLLELKGYNEHFKYSQDYELWFRMLAKGFKLANIPEYLTVYREHSGAISIGKKLSQNENMAQAWQEGVKLITGKHVKEDNFLLIRNAYFGKQIKGLLKKKALISLLVTYRIAMKKKGLNNTVLFENEKMNNEIVDKLFVNCILRRIIKRYLYNV